MADEAARATGAAEAKVAIWSLSCNKKMQKFRIWKIFLSCNLDQNFSALHLKKDTTDSVAGLLSSYS